MKFKSYLAEDAKKDILMWAKYNLKLSFENADARADIQNWTHYREGKFIETYFRTDGSKMWFDESIGVLYAIGYDSAHPPQGSSWDLKPEILNSVSSGINFVVEDIIIPNFSISPQYVHNLELGGETYLGGDYLIKIDSFKNISQYLPNLEAMSIGTSQLSINCGILSLLKCPKLKRISVSKKINDSGEPIKAFKILNKHLKEKDLIACQEELLDAGLDTYAKL